MPWVVLSLLGALSCFIFYQDYTTRSIVLPLYILLLALGVFYSLYYSESAQQAILNTILNACFLGLQIILLKVVFGFKKIINHKIGIGDILFILCCCPFFSPDNFLVFYILSLLFSLGFYFLFLSKSQRNKAVPLAGIQAIFLFFFISVNVLAGNNTTENINFLVH